MLLKHVHQGLVVRRGGTRDHAADVVPVLDNRRTEFRPYPGHPRIHQWPHDQLFDRQFHRGAHQVLYDQGKPRLRHHIGDTAFSQASGCAFAVAVHQLIGRDGHVDSHASHHLGDHAARRLRSGLASHRSRVADQIEQCRLRDAGIPRRRRHAAAGERGAAPLRQLRDIVLAVGPRHVVEHGQQLLVAGVKLAKPVDTAGIGDGSQKVLFDHQSRAGTCSGVRAGAHAEHQVAPGGLHDPFAGGTGAPGELLLCQAGLLDGLGGRHARLHGRRNLVGVLQQAGELPVLHQFVAQVLRQPGDYLGLALQDLGAAQDLALLRQVVGELGVVVGRHAEYVAEVIFHDAEAFSHATELRERHRPDPVADARIERYFTGILARRDLGFEMPHRAAREIAATAVGLRHGLHHRLVAAGLHLLHRQWLAGGLQRAAIAREVAVGAHDRKFPALEEARWCRLFELLRACRAARPQHREVVVAAARIEGIVHERLARGHEAQRPGALGDRALDLVEDGGIALFPQLAGLALGDLVEGCPPPRGHHLIFRLHDQAVKLVQFAAAELFGLRALNQAFDAREQLVVGFDHAGCVRRRHRQHERRDCGQAPSHHRTPPATGRGKIRSDRRRRRASRKAASKPSSGAT